MIQKRIGIPLHPKFLEPNLETYGKMPNQVEKKR